MDVRHVGACFIEIMPDLIILQETWISQHKRAKNGYYQLSYIWSNASLTQEFDNQVS